MIPGGGTTARERARPRVPRLRARRRPPPLRLEHEWAEREPGAVDVAGSVGERAQVIVGLLAFLGPGLLLAGELVDRLEHVEGEVGLAALNLIFATAIATIVVCVAALVGDSVLAAVEQRLGRRPGAGLVTPLLALCGGAAAAGILVAHVRHPLGLDGWVGLAGSVLLLVASVAHHHLSRTATPRVR